MPIGTDPSADGPTPIRRTCGRARGYLFPVPHTFSADSSAPPEAAWALMARPDRWHEWSPHVRGAWNLGEPEVQEGRLGAARLLGVAPVPARIVARTDRSWTWKVGPVTMVHAVAPLPGGGSRVSITLQAPGPLDRAIALSYGPVCSVLMGRLARKAETASSSTGTS